MADAWLRDTGIGLDRDAEAPVGLQLAWSVRTAVAAGRLVAGERLPGARELADALGVNVNTVRAVIGRLVEEGLLDVRHGSGTYVAGSTPGAGALAGLVERTRGEARDAGVDPRDLAAALYVAAPEVPRAGTAAARRRELRAEIAVLERALADLQERHGIVPPPADPQSGPAAGPRLLDIDALLDARDAVTLRLAELAAATVPPELRRPAEQREEAAAQARPAKTVAPRTRTRPATA